MAPRRPALPRASPSAPARGRVRRPGRGVRDRRGRTLAGLRHPMGGLQAAQRPADPRPLPRPVLLVQRRHPGDRRGRPRRSPGGDAPARRPAGRPARGDRGSRRGGDRDQPADPARADRGRRIARGCGGRDRDGRFTRARARRADRPRAREGRDCLAGRPARERWVRARRRPAAEPHRDRPGPAADDPARRDGDAGHVRRGGDRDDGGGHGPSDHHAALEPDLRLRGDPRRRSGVVRRAGARGHRVAVCGRRSRRTAARDRPGQQCVRLPGARPRGHRGGGADDAGSAVPRRRPDAGGPGPGRTARRRRALPDRRSPARGHARDRRRGRDGRARGRPRPAPRRRGPRGRGGCGDVVARLRPVRARCGASRSANL